MDNNPPQTAAPQFPPVIAGYYKAGIIRRYLALLLDSLIFVPINILAFIFAAIIANVARNHASYFVLALSPMLASLIPAILFIIYNIFSDWKYGETLGKKWLKIKVINFQGQNPSLKQAILRETIGKFLSGLVLQLGYLWAIWDKNHQAWHDKLAKTYVVTTIPNNGKNPWYLYLLLIIPFISILAILAAVVVLVINPLDVQRRGQDVVRMSDLANLSTAIQIAQNLDPTINLCEGGGPSCEGNSDKNDLANRKIDGTGWVKIDLSKVQTTSNLSILPVDPTNYGEYYYRYCSNGIEWEINAKLDSNQNKSKMELDQGDNPNLYEVGTNLTLCSRRIRVKSEPVS